MLSDLIQLRNKLQPKSPSNLDAVQFDYSFWSDIEKLAKKERAKSLELVKSTSKHPNKPGIILKGSLFQTELKVAKMTGFDKEAFIDLLLAKHPEIGRAVLRELATKSVVETGERKTYSVIGAATDE